MKVLSLLLSLMISFNVLAGSGTISSLENHFDEYNYIMTVEWDQKDQKFYESQTQKFISNLADLIKEEGLTQEEIFLFAETKMKDAKALAALKLKFSLLDKNLGPEELAKSLREVSQDFYTRGASWNGGVATIVPVALIVLVIGYAVWFGITHECIEYKQEYSCTENSTCNWYSTDSNGMSYCESTSTNRDCGYHDVCSKYEKKK